MLISTETHKYMRMRWNSETFNSASETHFLKNVFSRITWIILTIHASKKPLWWKYITMEFCSSIRDLALTGLASLTIDNAAHHWSGFDRCLLCRSLPSSPSYGWKRIFLSFHYNQISVTPIFPQVTKQSLSYSLQACPHEDQLLSVD